MVHLYRGGREKRERKRVGEKEREKEIIYPLIHFSVNQQGFARLKPFGVFHAAGRNLCV